MVDVGQVNEVGDNAEDIPKLICASGTTILAVMIILHTYVTGAPGGIRTCCS